MKLIYGILCVFGLIIPMAQFVPWFMEHGFDLMQLIRDIGASNMAAFAWANMILTAVTLVIFIIMEGGGRLRMRCILPGVAGTLFVGPSFGMPLFLLLREYELDKKAAIHKARLAAAQTS